MRKIPGKNGKNEVNEDIKKSKKIMRVNKHMKSKLWGLFYQFENYEGNLKYFPLDDNDYGAVII